MSDRFIVEENKKPNTGNVKNNRFYVVDTFKQRQEDGYMVEPCETEKEAQALADIYNKDFNNIKTK